MRIEVHRECDNNFVTVTGSAKECNIAKLCKENLVYVDDALKCVTINGGDDFNNPNVLIYHAVTTKFRELTGIPDIWGYDLKLVIQ